LSDLPRLRFPRSEPARLILLCLLLSIATTAPVLMFVYERTDRLFHDRIVNRLDDRERNLFLGYRTGSIEGLIKSINDEIESGVARGGVILLVDRNSRKLIGNMGEWPPTLRVTRWTEMRLFPEDEQRAGMFALRTFDLPSGQRLLIGTNIDDRNRMRDSLAEALIAALILSVPFGFLSGLAVLRVAKRRINELDSVSGRIAAGDVSQRLEAREESSALGLMTDTINSMLERTEELVNQMRLVTDALAHDLRSPLTRMRASIEKAASQCSDENAQQAFELVSMELDGMMRLITATLEISRTEAGIGRENFAEFDVGELLRGLCEMYHPLAEERGVLIRVENGRSISYFGNRELVAQVVSNLVDNALKYGGDEINMGAEDQGAAIRLWVADSGPGIPEDRRADALRKYGRLEHSRTSDGSGLGLALVRAVARLHGGDLLLESNDPGLRAVITLPRIA
jgi:signal transduction histidine kinase